MRAEVLCKKTKERTIQMQVRQDYLAISLYFKLVKTGCQMFDQAIYLFKMAVSHGLFKNNAFIGYWQTRDLVYEYFHAISSPINPSYSKLIARLPFMEKSTLPICLTQETAKETHQIYVKTQFKTNPQKDCLCVERCEETIFLPSVRKINIHHNNMTKLSKTTYFIANNIREVIEEEKVISIVKLLCNVGSIIGILTGLSIFGLVENSV
uniref:Uncharacterized protein n=1 Tax=Strigamia maritima TaxID=126957 RepID=T1JDS2_STRMM